jgi:hypothetical protein
MIRATIAITIAINSNGESNIRPPAGVLQRGFKRKGTDSREEDTSKRKTSPPGHVRGPVAIQ